MGEEGLRMFRKKNDCDIRRKVWNWGMKCARILEERNGGEEVDEKDRK
jgi:hypothetical protein